MLGIGSKQLARIGEFLLEEAILDVLLQAWAKDECLGAAEISRRAGIFREGGGGGSNIRAMNDAIVTGMLVKLRKEGKVERCEQRPGVGGWKLTEAEFERRRAPEVE